LGIPLGELDLQRFMAMWTLFARDIEWRGLIIQGKNRLTAIAKPQLRFGKAGINGNSLVKDETLALIVGVLALFKVF
jgi:hypothetical protein